MKNQLIERINELSTLRKQFSSHTYDFRMVDRLLDINLKIYKAVYGVEL